MAETGCSHDQWRVEPQNTAGFGRCLVCTLEIPIDTLFNGLRERMEAQMPTAARVLQAYEEKLFPIYQDLGQMVSGLEDRVSKLEDSILCPTCKGTGRKRDTND